MQGAHKLAVLAVGVTKPPKPVVEGQKRKVKAIESQVEMK